MMTLTLEQLKELKPCSEGFTWYSRNIKTEDVKEILTILSSHSWEWCRWLFVRLLNANQNRRLAIYCAELVLPIFENRFPCDKRPRDAIEASKKYLLGEIDKKELLIKRRAAYDAADAAADAADAAYDADAYAYAAAYAAYAAAADADAAAAYDAAADADCAVYAAAADASMKQKIVGKVIDLLKEGDK